MSQHPPKTAEQIDESIRNLRLAHIEPLVKLDELGLKYGSDKSSFWHNYLKIYATYFEPRDDFRKVLEIGVDRGASLRVWRDWFRNATIFGLDIKPSCAEIPDLGPERIQIIIGDATKHSVWFDLHRLWDGGFDLIIDDGAHTTEAIGAALEHGWRLLRPGGLYVIEDLHCVYHTEYASVAVSPPALWVLIFGYIHDGLNTNGEPQRGDPAGVESDVAYVHFYRSLCIIKKR
jgi:SAM-dependent methyltransferase